MPQRIEVTVPDIGDFKDVEVIDVLVKPGDSVVAEAPLVTLETEKATMDVPSTAAGRVTQVVVTRGDRVSQGSLVVVLEADASASAAVTVAAPPVAPVSPAAAASQSAPLVQEARAVEVRVPDLGDFKDVEVIDVLVKPGDPVEVDASLATLETEKATMDVPSSTAGIVQQVHLAKGARVSAGDLVVTLLAAVAPAATATAAAASVTPPARAATPVAAAAPSAAAPRIELAGGRLPPIEEAGFSRAHAGPSVRRLARELGVDLGRVKGTGVKGRVSHDDVKAYVKQALAQPTGAAAGTGLPRVPEVDFAAFGPVEVKPLGRIQRISGARLHASWVNLPHVTQFDQADITDLELVRAQLKQKALDLGIKLTPLAFLVRATVKAIAKFPDFCASLDAAGQNLVYKKYCHIGFAADTPNGLVVPVIRDADRKDIYEIARDLGVLSEKARAGKLPAADMQGGCFTISSLGGIGGTAFTPIINAPEVAILGVSRSQLQPVWRDTQFVPRLLLPLSLSYDHRVIDGAVAARFTTFLAETLGEPRALTEAVP